MNNNYDVNDNVLDNAERIIGKNIKKLIPIFILTVIIGAAQSQIALKIGAENIILSVFLSIVLGIITYPVIYLGVSHYAIKLIRGESVAFKDIFYFYKNRIPEAFILSIVMTIMANLGSVVEVLRKLNLIGSSLMFDGVGLIVVILISIKLVLVPFIFVEELEQGTGSIIDKAWKLSRGRTWEIIKIFMRVLIIAIILLTGFFILAMCLSVVLIALPPIAIIIGSTGAVLLIGIITMYQSIGFAGFALRVFEENGLIVEENEE